MMRCAARVLLVFAGLVLATGCASRDDPSNRGTAKGGYYSGGSVHYNSFPAAYGAGPYRRVGVGRPY
jgi:hypothetical protein